MKQPPFGYDITEEGNLIPIEDDLSILEEVHDLLEMRAISLRDAATWLSVESSRSISHEGLRKRLRSGVRPH